VSLSEDTIDATLDADGHLQLAHAPRVPPGPVRVTVRAATPVPRRTLADVLREIAAGQRASGFPGRPAAEILADDAARADEDAGRDAEHTAARRPAPPGGP
jgi:hypothetical protein